MGLCLAIGAGAIGRSMTGEIFAGMGWEVVFVEASGPAVEALNRDQCYRIRDDPAHPGAARSIGPVRAIGPGHAEAAALAAAADVVCTAIGAVALDSFAATLAGWLRGRDLSHGRPPLILLFENGHGCEERVASALRDALGPDAGRIPVRRASVERMSRLAALPSGAAEVVAEPFIPAIIERRALPAHPFLADASRFCAVDGLARYYARKLYTNNLGHAAAAYAGAPLGHRTIVGALGDARVAATIEAALRASGTMLCRRYGFSAAEIDAHLADLLGRRYLNRLLNDELARLGRDPWRKLGRDERLVGCALECLACGVDPAPIVRLIVLALDCPADDGRSAVERAGGLGNALAGACGLDDAEPLRRLILAEYRQNHAGRTTT
ncbi:MAG: hypothetical protein GX558_02975 [Clostridiales bacterium]|nr:hypothetical protein [Clostridiales bacterium]